MRAACLLLCWFLVHDAESSPEFELYGKVGSKHRVGMAKSMEINRYLSMGYPVYDFSWSNAFFQEANPRYLSYNWLLSLPSAIHEWKRKGSNGKDSSDTGGFMLFALVWFSVPVAMGNLKLRLEAFRWSFLELGLETDYFPYGKSGGVDMGATLGVGMVFRKFNFGLYYVQALIKNEELPKQSTATGKLGYSF